jgi:SOS response associated peptidase (SRAP)
LFAFAGLWARWRGVRGPKSAPVEGEHELFGFLTTEANAIVAPIHPKAMPVVLTTPEEFDLWLKGETVEAPKLQRPLPDGMLDIVARGEKEDGPSRQSCLTDGENPRPSKCQIWPRAGREITQHGALSGKGEALARRGRRRLWRRVK